jgi:hypothetical protein
MAALNAPAFLKDYSQVKQITMNLATISDYGFVCPVKKCPKRHNRRFTLGGLFQHMRHSHYTTLVKKLGAKEERRGSPG